MFLTDLYLKLLNIRNTQKHPFHVLTNSRLPIIIATISGIVALIFITKLHALGWYDIIVFSNIISSILQPIFFFDIFEDFSTNITILYFLMFLGLAVWSWALNLFKESTKKGHHTTHVQLALKYGMLLFLVSEAMLFFPFFWAFFHGSLAPATSLGSIWPPVGIKGLEILDPFMLPLVNTIVLLGSGIALVGAHRGILYGHKGKTTKALFIAISLGIFFSWLQFLEYGLTKFTINDSLYGNIFFMLTGLHGFHVIIGTILLTISYWRLLKNNFSTMHHVGF